MIPRRHLFSLQPPYKLRPEALKGYRPPEVSFNHSHLPTTSYPLDHLVCICSAAHHLACGKFSDIENYRSFTMYSLEPTESEAQRSAFKVSLVKQLTSRALPSHPLWSSNSLLFSTSTFTSTTLSLRGSSAQYPRSDSRDAS